MKIKLLFLLVALLTIVGSSQAQTSFFSDRAIQQVNQLGIPNPVLSSIPYAFVRVCNLPLTQGSPCLPLASITDVNGNPLSNSIGSNFGQTTTDATGRFTIGCTLGANYQVQVQPSASNTPALNYPITCPGVGNNPQFNSLTVSGTLAANGGGALNGSFSGPTTLAAVSCTSVNKIPCVADGNPAGWAGANAGAWINSAISSLGGNPGEVDARGLIAAANVTATIAVPASVKLDLGPATFTCTVRPCFTYLSYSSIIGTSPQNNNAGTTILINDATTGDIIGPGSTGNVFYATIDNLFLNGTTIHAGQIGLDFTNVSVSRSHNVTCNSLSICQQVQIASPGTSAYYNNHYSLNADFSTTGILVDQNANANYYIGGRSLGSGTCADIGENGTQTNDAEFQNFVCETFTTTGYKFGPKAVQNIVIGGRLESGAGTGLVVSTGAISNSLVLVSRQSTGGVAVSDSGIGTSILDPGNSLWQLGGNPATLLTSIFKGMEAAAPTGLANFDFLWPDSIAHRLKMNNNNGGADFIVGDATTDTFTAAKTFGVGSSLNFNNMLFSPTAPTIAGAGCGGSGASILGNNGTADIVVGVGATPGSTCTITMPTASSAWSCMARDNTTTSASVYMQKQISGSTTSVVITNFNTSAVATAFVAGDALELQCTAR